uniref:OR143 n=1 Tax=Vicia faba TaxID=3906 RepID=R4IUU6_VICFA|nr:OR143 [Vicia faba]AGC78991.1 OR143 [Vicia faba]
MFARSSTRRPFLSVVILCCRGSADILTFKLGGFFAFVSVRGLPFPSYLLYADDILLFCAASISNAKEILKILKDYAEILGQFHNPDKTSRRSSLALDSLIGISFIVYNVGYKNQITYLPQHLSHQRHHLLVGRFLLLLKFSIT